MRRVTVKDIASELNISVGTVSKALSGRGSISEQTRQRVLDTTQKYGYSTNKLAQGLARKPTKIGIVMPKIWRKFYGYLQHGINKELSSFQDHKMMGTYKYVSNLYSNDEFKQALEYFLAEKMDSVILCPAFDRSYIQELEKLADNGVQVIILGNKLDTGGKFINVRVASGLAGSMAADYIYWLCAVNKSSAAVFIGNKDMADHIEKMEGFNEGAAKLGLSVNGVYETQDDPDIAYFITRKVLSTIPALGAIYVATGNSVAVCRCIEDMNMVGQVKVVGTDVFREMKPFVESGVIQALIYQNPLRQGQLAIRLIYDHVTGKMITEKEVLVYPELVLRSNFNVYSDYLEGFSDEIFDMDMKEEQ